MVMSSSAWLSFKCLDGQENCILITAMGEDNFPLLSPGLFQRVLYRHNQVVVILNGKYIDYIYVKYYGFLSRHFTPKI